MRASYNKRKTHYDFYQHLRTTMGTNAKDVNVKKLNPRTYKYIALNGDTESPYGLPPFLAALEPIVEQQKMKKNISFILDQLGLLGFFETLLEKPAMTENESDTQYMARLVKLLDDTKTNLSTGMKEGVMVGFKHDHEFQFHSTTQNLAGVSELYNQNEVQIANGAKTPPAFLGVSTSKSETQINIVFTKMLSQLRNLQDMLSNMLEFGYGLELMLAGYDYKQLTIKFKSSTLTDELKKQQSDEIKIRNLSKLYFDGVISMDTYADEMGYEEPDQSEPRVNPNAPTGDPSGSDDKKKKEEREKDKDKSDKKGRSKKKDQPKDK